MGEGVSEVSSFYGSPILGSLICVCTGLGFAIARICTDSGFSDQEDQLGALGLVMNAIILWNTLYMDRALAALRQAGVAVQPEDVTRLSPLGFKHVNLIGRYQFALPEAIARGEFRPLRDLAAPDDLEW